MTVVILTVEFDEKLNDSEIDKISRNIFNSKENKISNMTVRKVKDVDTLVKVIEILSEK